jgi:hypothetical protein
MVMIDIDVSLPAISVSIIDGEPVPADHHPGNPQRCNSEEYAVDIDLGAEGVIDVHHRIVRIIIPLMRHVHRFVVMARHLDIDGRSVKGM